MSSARQGKAPMSDAQKKAMAEGRSTSRSVARYLDALVATAPKRGRKRTPESIKRRLQVIEAKLPTASPIATLGMIQERLDLQAELEAMQNRPDLAAYEEDFIAAAKEYSERKGITWVAWRELGVDPAVLKRAGIGR